MTDREIRAAVFEHMAQAGALVRLHSDPETMQATAADDLYDACRVGSPVGLREAFTDASREFWLRDNDNHSRKVDERRSLLRLVTPDEFETIVYPRGRGA